MSATALSAAPEIEVPNCDRGIGRVITDVHSADLIDGIAIAPYTVWPDDRGYFLEVIRSGQGLAAGYARETTQVSAALSYPGSIKAFHFHRRQHDLWVPAMGVLQIALVDLRKGSRTYGVKNTIYAGPLRPWQLLIPAGVGHGYKVIGCDPAMLVYVTDRFYDPGDEGRVAYNDERLNYDWETQHR